LPGWRGDLSRVAHKGRVMSKIGYVDFLQILQLDEVGEWLPGHILKPDGVYVEPPDERLTLEEKKAMLVGVTGSLAEPILRFPCSVADMERYVSLLDDSVVEKNLREWLSAHGDHSDEPVERMVAWRREIVESWPLICAGREKPPTALEVVRWLRKNTNHVIRAVNDDNSLTWTNGSIEKSVKFGTVETAISELKTAGKLPFEKKSPP
jgi:hypothetical protein